MFIVWNQCAKSSGRVKVGEGHRNPGRTSITSAAVISTKTENLTHFSLGSRDVEHSAGAFHPGQVSRKSWRRVRIPPFRLRLEEQCAVRKRAQRRAEMDFPKGLPHFAVGEVVQGFGRGSRELGIPTANLAQEVVDALPREVGPGVYFGFASVDGGAVHKMVMSVGWNPYYKNERKSMETYVMHKFQEDFYGKLLRVVMLGYIRPEKNFGSLDELIRAIQGDVREAEERLELEEFAEYKRHEFFQS